MVTRNKHIDKHIFTIKEVQMSHITNTASAFGHVSSSGSHYIIIYKCIHVIWLFTDIIK